MQIRKVGVVGCGTMGRGIAEVSVRAGYPVLISDIQKEALDRTTGALGVMLTREVRTGKIDEETKSAILGRFKQTMDMADFSECDLVIEAAVEDIEAKKSVFATLDGICPEDTILATNTSCLSVTEIGSATRRQDKVLGLHFFNPVPLMKLIEAVKTDSTSDDALDAGRAFGESLGKTVITVPDTPGFIVNRLLLTYLSEAVRMLETGVATAEEIDRAVVLGLNHPMGPFKLLDFVGIDIACYMAEYISANLTAPHIARSVLLDKMVAENAIGRKSGKGFYKYG